MQAARLLLSLDSFDFDRNTRPELHSSVRSFRLSKKRLYLSFCPWSPMFFKRFNHLHYVDSVTHDRLKTNLNADRTHWGLRLSNVQNNTRPFTLSVFTNMQHCPFVWADAKRLNLLLKMRWLSLRLYFLRGSCYSASQRRCLLLRTHLSDSKTFLMSCLRFVCSTNFLCPSLSAPPSPSCLDPPTPPVLSADFTSLFLVLPTYWHFLLLSPVVLVVSLLNRVCVYLKHHKHLQSHGVKIHSLTLLFV